MNKIKDKLGYFFVYASISIVGLVLIGIIGWVFYNGWGDINYKYLTSSTEQSSTFIYFKKDENYNFDYEIVIDEEEEQKVVISEIKSMSKITDTKDKEFQVETGDYISEVAKVELEDLSESEIHEVMDSLKAPKTDIKVKLTDSGGGVYQLILTTLFIVFWSILFAVPIGMCAAIYLIEYEVNPLLNKIIHFAIDSLAGIPSIIFGLFGTLFFSQTLGLGQSLLAGILTVTIMLLPIIIKSIEEALRSVPQNYREASYGLGASKTQTLFNVVVPSSLPGILVSVILAMGRVIGESAIFIFVVGTSPALPTFMGKGASLTVYAYRITRETPNFEMAAGVAVVIFILILFLNITAKIVARKIGR